MPGRAACMDHRRIWLSLGLNVVLCSALFLFVELNAGFSSRYTLYLILASALSILIFNLDSSLMKIAICLIALFFIDISIISRMNLLVLFNMDERSYSLTLCASGIISAISIFAILLIRKPGRLSRISCLCWLGIFTGALISSLIGSFHEPSIAYINMDRYFIYILEFFMFFYFGFIAFNKPGQYKNFIYLVLFLAIIVAVAHLSSLAAHQNIETIRSENGINPTRDLSKNGWRNGGFFGNANNLAAFYVMLIPSAFMFLFNEPSIKNKILCFVSLLSMSVSLVFLSSRAGFGFCLGGILLALLFLRIRPSNIIAGVLSLGLIIILANQLIENYFADYLIRTQILLNEVGLDTPRYEIWRHSLNIIKDYPLGIGLAEENYSQLLIKYGNMSLANPHSMYLEVIVKTGYLGFASFLVLVVSTATGAIRGSFDSADREEKAVLAAMFLIISGYMMMGFTEPIFSNEYKLNHFFGLILGITLSLVIKRNSQAKEANEQQTN